MRKILSAILLFVLTACTGVTTPAASPRSSDSATAQTTVSAEAPGVAFLVRHAEKVDESKDPPLSLPGRERAEALARILGREGITRIFTTDYLRTRETAAPLAKRLGIEPEVYDPKNLDDLAAKVKSAGGTVLIVGHSNTTPDAVRALGGEPGDPIADAEYDRLYRVELSSGRTTLQRYGVIP